MIASALLLISASFALLAAIGLVRMPDVFTKMHAVSKAGAFGGSVLLMTAAYIFGTPELMLILANIVFFYFTTPVAAQMLGKSAVIRKTKTWDKTSKDELDF